MDNKQKYTAEASERTSKERRQCQRENVKLMERRNNKTLNLSKDSRFSIRNFRPVSGFRRTAKVYRCGSTDVLGARIRYSNLNISATNRTRTLLKYKHKPSKADILVQRDAGLVIDLRSAPERKEEDAIVWMNQASGRSIWGEKTARSEQPRQIRVLTIPLGKEGDEASTASTGNHGVNINSVFRMKEVQNMRYVVRLDVLNRVELLNYARKEWLRKSPSSNREDDHDQIITELNKRGLTGLNEAILETPCGQKGMCVALKLVTLYREALARTLLRVDGRTDGSFQNDDGSCVRETASIVFHCVQGKDRTGMLAMLMQLLVGCSDEIIVDDYYQSNAEFVKRDAPTASTTPNYEKSSAAASMILSGQRRNDRVRMDPSVFRGTNRAAMEMTLEGLRQRHGQNLDKYFDSIGFDNAWRKRFVAVLGLAVPTSRL